MASTEDRASPAAVSLARHYYLGATRNIAQWRDVADQSKRELQRLETKAADFSQRLAIGNATLDDAKLDALADQAREYAEAANAIVVQTRALFPDASDGAEGINARLRSLYALDNAAAANAKLAYAYTMAVYTRLAHQGTFLAKLHLGDEDKRAPTPTMIGTFKDASAATAAAANGLAEQLHKGFASTRAVVAALANGASPASLTTSATEVADALDLDEIRNAYESARSAYTDYGVSFIRLPPLPSLPLPPSPPVPLFLKERKLGITGFPPHKTSVDETDGLELLKRHKKTVEFASPETPSAAFVPTKADSWEAVFPLMIPSTLGLVDAVLRSASPNVDAGTRSAIAQATQNISSFRNLRENKKSKNPTALKVAIVVFARVQDVFVRSVAVTSAAQLHAGNSALDRVVEASKGAAVQANGVVSALLDAIDKDRAFAVLSAYQHVVEAVEAAALDVTDTLRRLADAAEDDDDDERMRYRCMEALAVAPIDHLPWTEEFRSWIADKQPDITYDALQTTMDADGLIDAGIEVDAQLTAWVDTLDTAIVEQKHRLKYNGKKLHAQVHDALQEFSPIEPEKWSEALRAFETTDAQWSPDAGRVKKIAQLHYSIRGKRLMAMVSACFLASLVVADVTKEQTNRFASSRKQLNGLLLRMTSETIEVPTVNTDDDVVKLQLDFIDSLLKTARVAGNWFVTLANTEDLEDLLGDHDLETGTGSKDLKEYITLQAAVLGFQAPVAVPGSLPIPSTYYAPMTVETRLRTSRALAYTGRTEGVIKGANDEVLPPPEPLRMDNARVHHKAVQLVDAYRGEALEL